VEDGWVTPTDGAGVRVEPVAAREGQREAIRGASYVLRWPGCSYPGAFTLLPTPKLHAPPAACGRGQTPGSHPAAAALSHARIPSRRPIGARTPAT
jgi:hypothetical protein